MFDCINLNNYKYGYVCITGASDGIGKSMVKQFAKRGFKILMISRSADKLENVKREILKKYPKAIIEYIAADFSKSHVDPKLFYSDLNRHMENYDISVLVNNVGIADRKMLLNELEIDIENQIGVNIYPQTLLSYFLIPKFVARWNQTSERSLMINLSSTAELGPVPIQAVYSATKKYNSFFSEALAYEYRKYIDVATIKPGVVITHLATSANFTKFPLNVKSDDYASHMLRSLRKGVNYGHWKHKIMAQSISLFPYQIQRHIIQLMMPL